MPEEQQLSNVLSEFARTLVTDFPIQGILDHLVERIVDVLPITAAGVTLIAPGRNPQYVAASDDAALRFEKLQTQLGDGPCLQAYDSGDAVAVPDLRTDPTFPIFAPLAVEAGLLAVFTFPLRDGTARMGALDLYRDVPGPLSEVDMVAAQTLADVTAAYLLNARTRGELQRASDVSREMALHDPLTGLPNRTLLLERLEQAVRRGARSKLAMAVLFADLDRFKLVNDLYGHDVGDELLVAVAERLTAALRPGDTLARISGDEFVVLCEDLEDPDQVDVIASRIVAAFTMPFSLLGTDVGVTASVGIAFAGQGSQHHSEQLLRQADTAMYQAKRKGGSRHQVIDLREQHLAEQREDLERDLRGATARGELHLVYQPIVVTADGQISGVEALLRWAHPRVGLIPPAVAIPLAEQSGTIVQIGDWVLRQACRDLHSWQLAVPDGQFAISVNASAYELMAPGYAASVARALADTDTDPSLVTLELTESVFLHDSERALLVLTELKSLDVHLALDDFGTGYSSLNYLKRFPIDVVKIDQGFVADLHLDTASDAIVAAIVDLAHKLHISVVAEGVETAQQHEQLTSLNCDASQGYHFARPMSAEDIGRLLTVPASAPPRT